MTFARSLLTKEKFSVGVRIDSDDLFEAAQEMALVSKAAFKRDFRQREIFVRHQRKRFFDAHLPDVFAKSALEMLRKISRKVNRMDIQFA